MTFIKLSDMVINASKITSIRMYNNKYIINVLNNDVNGIFLAFSGSISSTNNQFEVCSQERKADYAIITNWINARATDSFIPSTSETRARE